ncbi:MAG: transferrin receptor-like dimerization domain-containing protein [Candidatus Neomarinimicrobiota bacterium]|nr:transferrin receptor-like dimerization domain-containing protein [Candidatus Neomarinimicrobiota bacterium]
MKNNLLYYLLLMVFIGCSQQPNLEPEKPNIAMVSTFDVALDSKSQLELESEFDKVLNAQNLDKWMKHMSSKPHHVGSPWSKQNAEYIANKFKEWGYDAEIETFEVLVPFPKIRKLKMIAPSQVDLKLFEPELKEDATSGITENVLPGYNAFSADGNVTAELVFVNYGIPKDYEELKRMGIDVRGKIVIAKYGGSWRGIKPKVAYENGAIGCIMYSDPKNDGYVVGDVYPEGPYRMEYGIQRGSVVDMPMYPGDALTPGYGAKKDVERLSIEDAPTIMKIPVMPISYADALPLLKALKGPVVPNSWKGGLPITYHIGPGPTKVNLHLEFDWGLRTAYNPIGRLKGSVYPDEWIMRGNHHDGWAQGAADPISGMVSLMEEARAIGELVKTGWRPKRSLIYAGWDAEEPGLLGSTEWVEYHRDDIKEKMIAYINTDGTGVGYLSMGGSHSLEKFVNEIIREVKDPVHEVTLESRLRSRLRVREYNSSDYKDQKESDRDDLRLYPMGSGSDYTAFIHHAGVPSLNLGFGGESGGGSYHSIYDSYDHYKRFSDGEFQYGTTLAQVNGRLVMRLSEADILPFRFVNMVDNIGKFIDDNKQLAEDIKKHTQLRNKLLDNNDFTIARNPKKKYLAPDRLKQVPDFNFKTLEDAFDRLTTSAWNYEIALSKHKKGSLSAEQKSELNVLLKDVEQALTSEKGLPRRDWFKNMIYAPGYYTGYGVKTLPGIREGLEERKWNEVRNYIEEIAKALDRASAKINSASKLLAAD